MRVAAVTATRAEFGLQTELLRKIQESPQMTLQLIVTGTHLLEEFGQTVSEIHSTGIPISATVTEITEADSGEDVAHQVGAGIRGFTKALADLQPNVMIIVGDRYEMLAASIAAFFLDIPILHLHGGEVTEGAFDDSIRHAITKLSSVHCVAHEVYAKRVIQMGEHPKSVHTVGGLGVDALKRIDLKSREELEKEFEMRIREPFFLVTQHPLTTGPYDALEETKFLIQALDWFEEATVVFTMPNADPNHRTVEYAIRHAVGEREGRWYFYESLGQQNYWSMMALATAVIGNSSSGILEAPSFAVPTVNIGQRQTGRIMAQSVVSCEPRLDSIVEAINRVLEPNFCEKLNKSSNPFDRGGTAERVLSVIKALQGETRLPKGFYDLTPHGEETPNVD